jgi:hypothetical protein
MEKATRTKNRIALPTFGAELFTYLKDVNDHESFTASMRLKDVLSERLKNEINGWFSVPAIPELDRTLLRKITNSLLSAGTIGEKRTKDALSEIRFEHSNLNLEMNVTIATEKLREWSRDFRSAKGFLDHQYKCINSFLRIQKTTNDENVVAAAAVAVELDTIVDDALFKFKVNFINTPLSKGNILKNECQYDHSRSRR